MNPEARTLTISFLPIKRRRIAVMSIDRMLIEGEDSGGPNSADGDYLEQSRL